MPEASDSLRTSASVKARELSAIRNKRPGAKEDDLVGLAFSGGGIRSATFNLGVLEALKELELLERIDYLSTVSGGGYIGAWLSANCHRQADWLAKARPWEESIKHLRRYSNYLAPIVGVFSADTWAMAMVWIRNTLLVQATVILAIACALIVPRALYPVFQGWQYTGSLRWLTIALLTLAVAGIAGNQWRVSRNRDNIGLLQATNGWIGLVTGGPLLGLVWILWLFGFFDPFAPNAKLTWWSGFAAALVVAGGSLLLPFISQVIGWSVRLGNRLKIIDGRPPKEINYNQAWTQLSVVLPMMVASALIAAILWWEAGNAFKDDETYGKLLVDAWSKWPFPLTVAFACLLLLAISSVQKLRSGWGVTAVAVGSMASCAALYGLLCAVVLIFQSWRGGPEGDWRAYVWGPPMVLYAISLSIVVLIGMLGRQSTEGSREWWSRLGAWLGIYGLAWMLVEVATVYGPYWTMLLMATVAAKYSLIGGWVATTGAGLLAGNSGSTGGKGDKTKSVLAKEVLAAAAPFVFIIGLLLLVSYAVHSIILLNGEAGVEVREYWYQLSRLHLAWQSLTWVVLGICAALLALFAGRVDINEFSLNAFYRSRLVRCFLGATKDPAKRRPQRFTEFDDRDDLPLAKLLEVPHPHGTPTGSAPSSQSAVMKYACGTDETDDPPKGLGPFHIINCALNLGGSSDLGVHTRHSANFILTPQYCGSPYKSKAAGDQELGFVNTKLYGGEAGQPTIGQAISVSGAAASPNMGYHTSSVVAFLMTLFNARLGWWFPKPNSDTSKCSSPSPWFSMRYLLLELFGLADDKSKYLAISDGGHFENLAAYELIRRRCAVVIIGDAECDPEMKFEGLGTLIRVCRVDFEAEIEIDVSSLKKNEAGWSHGRCAVGTIRYKPDPTETGAAEGTLIYIKASMNGHEKDASVVQYKDAHPDFPHETTADQFYGEDQFESYRLLGREIAMMTFQSAVNGSTGNRDLIAMANVLKDVWSPALRHVKEFTGHTMRLMDIWADVGKRSNLAFLDSQLAKGWPDEPPKGFRSGYYTGIQLLQLMENVYLDLRLDETWNHPDNSGWRTTFEIWAKAPLVQAAWDKSRDTFGRRFQYFCQYQLKLN